MKTKDWLIEDIEEKLKDLKKQEENARNIRAVRAANKLDGMIIAYEDVLDSLTNTNYGQR